MSRRWLIAASTVAHLAIGVGLFASGIWRIERVEAAAYAPMDLRVPSPPPPARQLASGSVAVEKLERKKIIPDKVVQLEHREPAKPTTGTTTSQIKTDSDLELDEPAVCLENCGPPAPSAAPVCGNGSRETDEQCDDGNLGNGDGCSASCRIEAKPRPATVTIGASVLQGLRISGETQIRPSSSTQSMIMHDGERRVTGSVRLCVSTVGNVESAAMLTSTKYDDYDATLLAAVRSWRYQPYTVNRVAVRACSVVTFVYAIR